MNHTVKPAHLPLESINPRVLKSYIFSQGLDYPKGHKFEKRLVTDYELEFFVQSDGAMYIEDKLYPIHKGDVVFRRPGETTQGIMPYSCYLIFFDLSHNLSKDPANYVFYEANEVEPYYTNPVLDAIPRVYHPFSGEKYQGLFDLVLKEYINPTVASPMLLKAYTLQLLYQLYQDVSNPLNSNAVLPSPHGRLVKTAVDYIRDHIHSPLNLETLAQQVGLSPNYFHKVFCDTMGFTPNDYITKLRLEKAKELLVITKMQVYEIAVACGIDNTPYFSYLFKKHLGQSPLEFRKQHSFV